jgi:hypothetical protein
MYRDLHVHSYYPVEIDCGSAARGIPLSSVSIITIACLG